jgi:hypothetical protein
VKRGTEEVSVAKKTPASRGATAKRTRQAAPKRVDIGRAQAPDKSRKTKKPDKSRKTKKTARSGADDQGNRTPGWGATAAAYASLGLAKSLRVAASTIGMARRTKRR